MIYLFRRDEGTFTSSLPPIKIPGSRQLARSYFEEKGGSKGILFSTDIYCNNIKCLLSSLMYTYPEVKVCNGNYSRLFCY